MVLCLREGSECQEIRDTIYGLLGLVKPELRIKPDYNKEPVHIVTEIIMKQACLSCNQPNFLAERDLFIIWDLCKKKLILPAKPPVTAIRKWERVIVVGRHSINPFGQTLVFHVEEAGDIEQDASGRDAAHNISAARKVYEHDQISKSTAMGMRKQFGQFDDESFVGSEYGPRK
jgi:hypothetical protein